jgi:hypothetical protein
MASIAHIFFILVIYICVCRICGRSYSLSAKLKIAVKSCTMSLSGSPDWESQSF